MMRARQGTGIAALARLVGAIVPNDATVDLRIPGVHAARVSQPNQEPVHYVQQSSLCIAAQGAKTAMVGGDTYNYEAGQMALYSVDVPIVGRVTRATYAEPYLVLMIDLDAEQIAALVPKVFPDGVPKPRDTRALYVGDADAHIVDAAARLVELIERPAEAELLAPLVRNEILIRLLRSPMGSRVAQIGQAGSSMQRVANAVSWLRTNFDQPANIEELATLVNMSVTSFHRQFKAVTGMSPLQYQKTLRLQEARRLMLTAMIDTGAAGRRVGYMSAAQFSREYSRFFGSAPKKDIDRLREHAPVAAEHLSSVPRHDTARLTCQTFVTVTWRFRALDESGVPDFEAWRSPFASNLLRPSWSECPKQYLGYRDFSERGHEV